MMRCIEFARTRPLWTLLQAGIAVFSNMALLILLGWWFYESRPSQLALEGYRVEPREEGTGFWLIPTYHWSESALKCGRVVDMRIYPLTGPGDDPSQPILLGTFIGGPRFSDNQSIVHPVVTIPLGVHGDWDFVSRVSYFCPPLHLIAGATTTPPVRVKVP